MQSTINVDELKPINGNVFVLQENKDEKTKSGIITTLVRQKHMLQSKGKIVAFDNKIGEQCLLILDEGKIPKFVTKEFEIGETAFFDNYAGKYHRINDQEYVVLKYTEIIGIMKNDDTLIHFSNGGLGNIDPEHLKNIMD